MQGVCSPSSYLGCSVLDGVSTLSPPAALQPPSPTTQNYALAWFSCPALRGVAESPVVSLGRVFLRMVRGAMEIPVVPLGRLFLGVMLCRLHAIPYRGASREMF